MSSLAARGAPRAEADPRSPGGKGLSLAGSAAFERQDFDAALKHWSRARARATPGSDFANGLDRSMEAARSSAGVGVPPVKTAARQSPASAQVAAPVAAPVAAAATPAAAASLSGTVSIAAPAVRTVSDRADDDAHADFSRFIREVASRYSLAILTQWLAARP